MTENEQSAAIDQDNTEQSNQNAEAKSLLVQSAAGEAKAKLPPMLSGFLANLARYFSPLELKKQWRELPTGLFVDNELLAKLLQSLADFRARETGAALSVDDKLTRLLFGDYQNPPQYYLLEGKLCLVGYFIDAPGIGELKLGLPFFRGSLIDCRQQLHPRDPLLAQLSAVQTSLDRSGFSVRLKIADRLVTVPPKALSDFHQVLLSSARLRSRNRTAARSLRDCLVPLGRLLNGASLVNPRQTLFIPGELRREKRAEFYRRGGLVFVLVDDELRTVYELRGRNLTRLIDQELSQLKSQRTFKISNVTLSHKPGAIIAAIRTADGEQNLLHMQMLLRMLELVLRRRNLRRELKPRFTLFDLLRLFSNLFSDTVRIEPREVPYVLLKSYLNLQARKNERRSGSKGLSNKRSEGAKRRKQQSNSSSEAENLRYRSGGGWIFFIHDRRVIRSMLERKVPPSPTPS